MDMRPDNSFHGLQARLRTGDGAAAALVFERYARRLVGLARKHLSERVRRKTDPEDVIQSVFRSFFHRCADGQFTIENWDGLWGLLVRLTLRKCDRRAEHFRAARRDIRREVAPGGGGDAEAAAFADLPSGEPTPLEAALLADAVERLMAQLATPVKRRILELSLQGYTVPEISAQVGHYERGVERVRAEIKKLLQDQLDATPPEPE
jgi:RNA polymerase sigma-70 factor (ECF subfamily)